MNVTVRKYGGSSLRTPEQIKAIARNVSELHNNGEKIILVLSAMGNSTNELCQLAEKISDQPNRRELDMLLSTGERVSTSLMSMALNDAKCPAISFTGSQAGVFTDNSHNNAKIVDIKPIRLEAELEKGKVVVIAGFQGVAPDTKEITTLGRGGSDTTAVALAAYFKTRKCEILKDVDGVYSGDPNTVTNTKQLKHLSYNQLLEMSYWGAKVIHYRAIELARELSVEIFIGLAHGDRIGTRIDREGNMYEQNKILAVNSQSDVRELTISESDLGRALSKLHNFLTERQLPWPQLIDSKQSGDKWTFLITAPQETLNTFKNSLRNETLFKLDENHLSSVTATCQGAFSSDLPEKMSQRLSSQGIKTERLLFNTMSITAIISPNDRSRAVQALHDMS